MFAFKRMTARNRKNLPEYVRQIPTSILFDTPEALTAYLHEKGWPTPSQEDIDGETDHRLWLALGAAR